MRHSYLLFVILTLLYKCNALVIDCNDGTTCAANSYLCTDEICEINCNAQLSCEDTSFTCDDSYLHSKCQINCMGEDGCKSMIVESHRDSNVLCKAIDACDRMDIKIYGDNPNDKIFANITSIASYNDKTKVFCYGDGIQECLLDCRDNGDYYTCTEVDFECHTPGICRYRCENSNACCGCVKSCGLFCSTLKENIFSCYYGDTNCIQEDPGGCFASYGCIGLLVEPTPAPVPITPPTQFPTVSPTNIPSINPSTAPTSTTTSPTKSPTPAPTSIPTKHPTEIGDTADPSTDPTKAPTPAPTDIPTSIPTIEPTLEPTTDPTVEPTGTPSAAPTFSPSSAPTKDRNKANCFPIIESIMHLIGVEADDFEQDIKFQTFVMNSTKAVIQEAIKKSHIYDIDALCENFWKCFYLDLINIGGNTILEINVCSWSNNVYNALLNKIVDDAEEMGAFMVKGLEFYLTGTDYKGYDGVIIGNLTAVKFMLATTTTPAPNSHGDVGTTTTTIEITKTETLNIPFYEEYFDYLLYGAIGFILICFCIFISICFCCKKQRKIKQELIETKQRIADLKSLSEADATRNIHEGDTSRPSNVSADTGEGIEAAESNGDTVAMNNNNVNNATLYQPFHNISPATSPISHQQIAMSNIGNNMGNNMGLNYNHNQQPMSMGIMGNYQGMMAMNLMGSLSSQPQQPINPMHQMTVPGPPPMETNGNNNNNNNNNNGYIPSQGSQMLLDADDLPESDKDEDEEEEEKEEHNDIYGKGKGNMTQPGIHTDPGNEHNGNAPMMDDNNNVSFHGRPQIEAVNSDNNGDELEYGNGDNDEYEYYEEYEEYEE